MATFLRVPMMTSAPAAASSFLRSTTKKILIPSSSKANQFATQQQRHATAAAAASIGSSSKKKKKRGYNKGVHVILTSDLPDQNGGMYTHEVHKVKPGFARNYLIPQKLALYATPANFAKLGLSSEQYMDDVKEEEKQAADDEGGEEKKAADFLAYYLRNKVLKIKRNVDPNTYAVYPGLVNALNLRQKLSKQLRIDLDDDHDKEQIHIYPTPVMHSELTEEDVDKIMADLEKKVGEECDVKLKVLGEFVARITLAGDHAVPLRFKVIKR